MPETLPLFDVPESASKIVDLAAYRAVHPRELDPVPSLSTTWTRSVSVRAAAHRQLMLRHLATQVRAAAGGRHD
jgi:hypothetical protein